MTIKKINNTSIDSNRVVLRPKTSYEASGSHVTGSMPLIQNPSNSIRTVNLVAGNQAFNFVNVLENRITSIKNKMSDPATLAAKAELEALMVEVSKAQEPSKHFKNFDIKIDNIPGFATGSKGQGKDIPSGSLGSIVNSIIKKDNASNENIQYGFSNYNCIGFVTSSITKIDTALIYDQTGRPEQIFSFAVSFFVKPPQKTTESFNPGTIFHIDNVVSISLVSGSLKDKNNNVNNFKIVSQLTSSNESTAASFDFQDSKYLQNIAKYSKFGEEVAYTTGSVLNKNQWHHVLVAYTNENGLGFQRIYIDGQEKGFSVRQHHIIERDGLNSSGNANPQIIIGNKINGSVNFDHYFNSSFNSNQKYGATYVGNDPVGTFESPFCGEIHEICYWFNTRRNIPVSSILDNRNQTTKKISNLGRPQFYLPVLFNAVDNQEMLRQPISDTNSVIVKKSPHENFLLSNGMKFPSVNITSFLKAYDFRGTVSELYPRCVGMEEIKNLSSHSKYASDFSNYHHVATQIPEYFVRNNLIRSCDNGIFSHNFERYQEIIEESKGNLEYLSSSLGNINTGHVLIKNYVTSSQTTVPQYSDVSNTPNNTYSENFIQGLGNPIFDKNINSIIQRPTDHVPFTKHFSGFDHSNLVTYIDIPSMFYSQQIHPGTFQMIDHDISGSDGMLTYKIKDNGLGALYRDDSAVSDTKNRCGFILYDLGVVILTHPSLCMFGKNHFEISFRGEHDLNVLNVNTHAGKYEFNNSKNLNYNQIGKIGEENNESPVTLITGVEYLDENLNVVMKSNFSQPVSKREFDEILFRSRIDI